MASPENRRSKTIYSFSGEQVYGAITGKIVRQERLAVMGHGYFGPEVARYHGVKNSCIARRFSSGSQKAR